LLHLTMFPWANW